jgi:hypothetical protein
MIRIDAMWLSVEPLDMRAGADRLLARVFDVFGGAQANHGYLFANACLRQEQFPHIAEPVKLFLGGPGLVPYTHNLLLETRAGVRKGFSCMRSPH